MHLFTFAKNTVLAIAFLLPSLTGPLSAQSNDSTKPDNTAVNQRERSPGEATADQQKVNAADLALTAKIRKSVMADKSLSNYAHNVKIISQNGTVTLNGPVRSDDEVKSIMAFILWGSQRRLPGDQQGSGTPLTLRRDGWPAQIQLRSYCDVI